MQLPLQADGSLSFLLLDVRVRSAFESGHLPCAVSFDATSSRSWSELDALKGCHLCIIGSGRRDDVTVDDVTDDVERSIVERLSERAFPFISVCLGGYRACHELLDRLGDDAVLQLRLVDHEPSTCLECRRRRHPAASSLVSPRWIADTLGRKLHALMVSPQTDAAPAQRRPAFDFDVDVNDVNEEFDVGPWRREVGLFPAELVAGQGQGGRACLLLCTHDELLALEDVVGAGDDKMRVISRHRLQYLSRVTRQKNASDVVTFHWFMANAAMNERAGSSYRVRNSRRLLQLVHRRCNDILRRLLGTKERKPL